MLTRYVSLTPTPIFERLSRKARFVQLPHTEFRDGALQKAQGHTQFYYLMPEDRWPGNLKTVIMQFSKELAQQLMTTTFRCAKDMLDMLTKH